MERRGSANFNFFSYRGAEFSVPKDLHLTPPALAELLFSHYCGFCYAAEPCGVARRFVPGAIDGAPCPAMNSSTAGSGVDGAPAGHYLGLPSWG